jgi:hypothetical protein
MSKRNYPFLTVQQDKREKSQFASIVFKNTIMSKNLLWEDSFREIVMIYEMESVLLHDDGPHIICIVFQVVEALVDLLCLQRDSL